MAETIRGITVKIGADTSDFQKSLKQIDKDINYSEKQVNQLQKQLELKFDTTKWSKAYNIVQKDLADTQKKSEAIKKQLDEIAKTGGVDSESYKKLTTELEKAETQAEQLQAKLEDLEKLKAEQATAGITKLSDSLETAAKKAAVLSAAAVGAIAGMVKLAKDAVSTGDEIQTLADKYNISAEAIQKWDYIALQSDVDATTLYKSMTKVRDAVGTAMTDNTNSATQALEALGLTVSEIPSDTEGAFTTVIEALAQVQDSTLQAYYANEIFGEKIATDLIPLLNQGSEGIAQFASEFETVGYLSNEQVAALSEFDNEMNKVNTTVENAKTQLGIALLPVYQALADLLTDVVVPAIQSLTSWFNSIGATGQKVILVILAIVAALTPVLLLMSKLVGAIPNLVKMFKTLTTAANGLWVKLGLIVAVFTTIFSLISGWKNMSTIEKILKTLAVAALVAAAAMTIFHASATMGVAVGIISAAVVAGIAAIKSASDSIGVDAGIEDTASSGYSADEDYTTATTTTPTTSTSTSNVTEDNSVYNIDITIGSDVASDLDVKELAEEVIKQFQIKKQAGQS